MFGSLLKVVGDVVEIAVTPIVVAATVVDKIIVEPVLEVARDIKKDVEDL
jgi:hypothetical protein